MVRGKVKRKSKNPGRFCHFFAAGHEQDSRAVMSKITLDKDKKEGDYER